MSERERLTGGGLNEVVRVGATVLRPIGSWSDTVHRLLDHLLTKGFTLAPAFHGLSDEGLEILDYLPGVTGGYPITAEASSDTALIGAARALRAFHDATTDFEFRSSDTWALPRQSPFEVICHNDFGPHNCVLRGDQIVGIIDFDVAGPGPRMWDVAYALYRWAPMSSLTITNANSSIAEQASRVRLFCDKYGLDEASRARVVDATIARLHAMRAYMRSEGRRGSQAYVRMLLEGHDRVYERDISYIEHHRRAFSS